MTKVNTFANWYYCRSAPGRVDIEGAGSGDFHSFDALKAPELKLTPCGAFKGSARPVFSAKNMRWPNPIRLINRFFETLFELPAKLMRLPVAILVTVLDIRFWIRMVLYTFGAVLLVMTLAYVAPVVWAPFGLKWFEPELNYFDQRSKGIGIYDARADYLGIFDPRMEPDFNSTSKAIAWENFTAYPDHKSEHVDEVAALLLVLFAISGRSQSWQVNDQFSRQFPLYSAWQSLWD